MQFRITVLIICLLAGTGKEPAADTLPPLIINYTKNEYKAASQNWSVTQSPERMLYFANSDGVLEYDGASFNLLQMPGRTIVRSVYTDAAGRIFTGSYREFGYWKEGTDGKFSYISLSSRLKDYDPGDQEIWKIIPEGERIWFQSFSRLYLYENDQVTIISPPHTLLFAHKVKDKIIVQGLGGGLYELRGKEFILLPGSERFAQVPVLTILPYGEEEILIGTSTKGLYVYDGTSFTPLDNELSAFLKKYQLDNGIQIHDGYAFGTIQNGLVITDEKGNIRFHLNRENGLQNNTVLSIYEDKDRNLWLGLDNGIDHIKINEPFGFYQDKSGLLGSVYAAAFYHGRLYIGTNHGVFYKETVDTDSPFTFLPGSHGQVWSLDVLDGQLLCGHNAGTFRITSGNAFRQISKITGGWIIRKVPWNENLLIQGTYTGLAVYRKEQGTWVLDHRIAGFSHPSKYMEFDPQGNLWVSRQYRGLYRLRLNEAADSIIRTQSYGRREGFPSDYNINVFKINNGVVFATGERLFVYDEVQGSISPFGRLNAGLGVLRRAHRILPAGDDNRYWFISNQAMALVRLEDYQVKDVVKMPYESFVPQMVSEYQLVVNLNEEFVLFGLDNGYALAERESLLEVSGGENRYPLFIRKVIHVSEDEHFLEFAGKDPLEVPRHKSNIRIEYASPVFGSYNNKFQVRLEGFDQAWSPPTELNYKEYTNLPAGTYTFHVRLLTDDGKSSPEASFQFHVLPPWYASWWAYILYLLLGLAVTLFFRRRYRRRLTRKHQQEMERLHHEKEEQFREERLLNQQQLIELENEKLQAELAYKSNELANSTMAIIKKNEVLIKVREELLKLKKEQDGTHSPVLLNKLSRVIQNNISNDEDWSIFEQNFNRAHEDFFKKLKTLHPELTPNDLRLCAYLKMNISSKEIAPLLNISVRGVEIRRYRLRKKLNLEHDANLVEYMMGM